MSNYTFEDNFIFKKGPILPCETVNLDIILHGDKVIPKANTLSATLSLHTDGDGDTEVGESQCLEDLKRKKTLRRGKVVEIILQKTSIGDTIIVLHIRFSGWSILLSFVFLLLDFFLFLFFLFWKNEFDFSM